MSGIRNVTPGVRMIALETPTLPPATQTNAYVLGERDALLVEPASPHRSEQRRLIEALADAGSRIRAIVVTHHHADHVGAVEAVRTALEVPVWAHPETAARLPFPVDRHLGEGDVVETDGGSWRVLHTPGHAPGHVCLSSPDGVVVAGDMVAGVGTVVIDPNDDGDMAAYLESLGRLRGLARLLLPAHGPLIEDAAERLDGYIAHRRARETRVLGAVRDVGTGELSAILARAYDDTPRALWPLALRSLEAHLRKLEKEGLVERLGSFWRASM